MFTSRIKDLFYAKPIMYLQDCYVSIFVTCRKCGEKIDPKNGYWKWDKNPALKHGYYHPDCRTLNNSKPRGFFPF
jgi:hypothetical protein